MLKVPKVSFSQAKDSYHQHDCVQRAVEKKLQSMSFPHLKSSPSVLELGCGDGVSSVQIAKHLKAKCYDAIDIADELIDKARKFTLNSVQKESCQQFNLVLGDFDKAKLWQYLQPKQYDFIYSNMALQWSECLSKLLKRIDQVLEHGGIFAFSIPMHGTFNELVSVARINSFMTHNVLLALMKQLNWRLIAVEHQAYELLFKNRLMQMKHLKNTGVNSYVGNEAPKMIKLKQYLANEPESGTQVKLSYQIGFYVFDRM